jgi:hypothetical protein
LLSRQEISSRFSAESTARPFASPPAQEILFVPFFPKDIIIAQQGEGASKKK